MTVSLPLPLIFLSPGVRYLHGNRSTMGRRSSSTAKIGFGTHITRWKESTDCTSIIPRMSMTLGLEKKRDKRGKRDKQTSDDSSATDLAKRVSSDKKMDTCTRTNGYEYTFFGLNTVCAPVHPLELAGVCLFSRLEKWAPAFMSHTNLVYVSHHFRHTKNN